MVKPKQTADLLITGRDIYCQDRHKTVLANGGLAILGDTIIETGFADQLQAKYPEAELLNTEHGLILPGLVNTRTHTTHACFPGLGDDYAPRQWPPEFCCPAEAALCGEMVQHASLLAMAVMIKSGTTSFCDMGFFARYLGRAAEKSGMRAWIGEILTDFPSPNYGDFAAGLEYVEDLFAMYGNHPLVNIFVKPQTVCACSPVLLKKLKRLAEKHDALYKIQLLENEAELKACRQRYGVSPVWHLDNLGLLDSRVVADHCVMLNEAEMALLAQREVSIVHCPGSNMERGSGIAPVPHMLTAGLAVGLGTDGHNADMFGEMNITAKVHKVNLLDSTAMPAETVLQMATIGGADILGAESVIGSLEPGKKADLIVLDMNQPHLTPLYNIPSHMVYAARGADVVHAVINGRIVMRNRKLLTLDENALLDNMAAVAGEIKTLQG